ncbi:MAG TPA: L,D-transpeptidase family protein [Hanamia sp.]|nr:L,D-transpeptidase family protein [Hanamia sp.]
MKIRNFKTGWIYLLASICGFTASAQLSPDQIQHYLSENLNKKELGINYQKEIRDFYAHINYQTAWIQQMDTTNLNYLMDNLSSATNWGLDEKDYQYGFISAFKKSTSRPQNLADSLKAEILFSDAAIHFYSDIAYGNTLPALGYTGIKYIPDCMEIPAAMSEFISKNKINLLTSFLSPIIFEVSLIENKINWILKVMNENAFKEISIVSRTMDFENKPLYRKLYQLGILDSANKNVSENILKQKIKEAQLMFNLPVNSELNKDIIHELNIPLKVRLKQLNLSINYYRWLSCLTQNQSVIVVNIPAAYLKVYNEQKVILEMRMVVGKPSTPTFTLASTVNEVIIYPYWYVPLSIAVKELLPAIKRNPSYLDANNYQVLDKAGKIIDPYSVNWHVLSRNNFPYTIRQGTGCDNALGLLKLNFYNPFGAYLHDTPDKNLFKQNRRFYSHGCMRMEKPIEMGHLILKNNNIAIDTLTEKGCLKSQSPVVVPSDVKIPVLVWYNPVGIDSTGNILFFEDVYKKFNWTK